MLLSQVVVVRVQSQSQQLFRQSLVCLLISMPRLFGFAVPFVHVDGVTYSSGKERVN